MEITVEREYYLIAEFYLRIYERAYSTKQADMGIVMNYVCEEWLPTLDESERNVVQVYREVMHIHAHNEHGRFMAMLPGAADAMEHFRNEALDLVNQRIDKRS